MQKITVSLGGIEYSGLPLTLDALDQVADAIKADAQDGAKPTADRLVLSLFLSDPETSPKVDGELRAYFGEAQAAVRAILFRSDLLGEKPPAPQV